MSEKRDLRHRSKVDYREESSSSEGQSRRESTFRETDDTYRPPAYVQRTTKGIRKEALEEAILMAMGDPQDDDDLEEITVPESTGKASEQPRKRLRPRCQYAEDCYRKNPHHFKAYCHPADHEWNDRGPRPKARCPFGSLCNR